MQPPKAYHMLNAGKHLQRSHTKKDLLQGGFDPLAGP
jgi:hypothetical protein